MLLRLCPIKSSTSSAEGNKKLRAGMMSSKDKQVVLELQYKISKCQEETRGICHEKHMLIIQCESLKMRNEYFELIRSVRLSEISQSEDKVKRLKVAVESAKKNESHTKYLISDMQEIEAKGREGLEKVIKEMMIMTEELRQKVKRASQV